MSGFNKRLVIPSLLGGIILVSGAVLAQSQAGSGVEVIQPQASLPVAGERAVLAVKTTEQPSESEVEQPQTTTSLASTPTTPTASSTTVDSTPTVSTPPVTTPTESTDEPSSAQPEAITATLHIQGPGISLKEKLELTTGATVYELLKQASAKFDFSLKVSHHSSLGMFVEGINGTLNDPKTNRYWLYYVNCQFAARGVSSQVVEEGDIIKWSYE